MIISTCGYGSTGSSAIADYLLECENIQVFDKIEFSITTMPDGLEDLEYHLMKQHTRLFSSIYAIQRFKKAINESSREWSICTGIKREKIKRLTDDFLNRIVQLKFVGDSPAIDKKNCKFIRHYFGYSIWMHRIVYKLEQNKILTRNHDYYPLEEVCAAIKPPNFYTESKQYICALLQEMGCDFTKTLVLDQGFSGNDPVKSFPFFDDPYAIVVDRDPRDLYIFAKKVLLSRGRFMPTDNVENFIQYYRMLRDNQTYKEMNPRVLRIMFEEMVYDYENATKKIDEFLSVKNINRKAIFKPDMSVANTNLFKKFPEFKEDVKKIEELLPEYLFHFENYREVSGGGKMFYGKSILNKQ